MSEWPSIKIDNYSRGYVDKIDNNKLPAGALKACRNVISRQIGRITSRNGQARLNSTEIGSGAGVHGLAPFYCGSTKYLLVAINGSVYYCTPPSGTMTQIKTGLDATAPVRFVTAYVDGKNQIMGFNGINTPFKWDGTTVADMQDYRTVSRETPTTSDYLTYTLANKPIRPGSDKFFVFSNNTLLTYESGYNLDEANGTITFSAARLNAVTDLDSDDAQTVTYNLNGRIELLHPFIISATYPVYIYDKNDILLKKLEDENVLDDWKADAANGVVNAPLTLDYVNLMPLTAKYTWPDVIKADYQYSNGNVSSQFRYPVTNKGRVFVMAGDEHIYWSDINENGSEYESWPPVNNWPVNQGYGETDGCLQVLSSEMYILLSRSIHRFRGNDLEDFRLERVVNGVGCTGPLAAAADEDGALIYFVSEQGLYSFDGVTARNLSRDLIPELWSTVNVSALGQAAVKVWHGLVLFSLPSGTSATNDMVFAYVPASASEPASFWPWDAMTISMWAEITTTSGTKLYSGKTASGYVLEQDTGDDDEGTNISSYFRLPSIDLGEADMLKKSRYVIVEHGEDATTWATVKLSKDYATDVEVSAVNANDNIRKYAIRPTITGKWRYLDIQLEHSQAGKFEVRSVKLPYKLKPKSSVKGDLA